jgi:hypothetical protein
MLIANPIYDSVFKYLLEDNEIAKGLLSAILEEEIISLNLQPQEYTQHSPTFLLTVLRMDFHAVIKTNTGDTKKVLIELQKGKELLDMMRFRNYLAENYKRTDKIDNDTTEQPLPIITIYFLGFSLQTVKVPVLKVARNYIDLIRRTELTDIKDEFVEKLTHDCYIIQIPLLNAAIQTRLERVLSIFNQNFMTQERKILNVPETPPEEDPLIHKMIYRLMRAIASDQVRQRMDAEESIEKAIIRALKEKENLIQLKEKEVELREKQIQLKNKEIEEKNNQIEIRDKQIELKDKQIELKDKQIEEKNKEIERLRNQLGLQTD